MSVGVEKVSFLVDSGSAGCRTDLGGNFGKSPSNFLVILNRVSE